MLEEVKVAKRGAVDLTVARCVATRGYFLRRNFCRHTWLRLLSQLTSRIPSELVCRASWIRADPSNWKYKLDIWAHSLSDKQQNQTRIGTARYSVRMKRSPFKNSARKTFPIRSERLRFHKEREKEKQPRSQLGTRSLHSKSTQATKTVKATPRLTEQSWMMSPNQKSQRSGILYFVLDGRLGDLQFCDDPWNLCLELLQSENPSLVWLRAKDPLWPPLMSAIRITKLRINKVD